MNIYYVEQIKRQQWGPSLHDMGCDVEDTTICHIVYAHDEKAALRLFYRREDEYDFISEPTIVNLGVSSRRRQGFTSQAIEDGVLLDYWWSQESK